MKKQYLFIVVLLTVLNFQAQECSFLMEPVSLQARANEATLIIEGKVVSSLSYWDTSHHNIYTIHEISVYKTAKGLSSTTVFIETLGGQVGEEMQISSSAVKLEKGHTGIFFLKVSNHSFSIPQTTYRMVAAAQGFIKYDKVDNTASDIFNKYTSVEYDVYSRLESATNKSLRFYKSALKLMLLIHDL